MAWYPKITHGPVSRLERWLRREGRAAWITGIQLPFARRWAIVLIYDRLGASAPCGCQERIDAITWARDRAVERMRTTERELEKLQAAYERLIVHSPACCIECDRENRAALPFPDNLMGRRMIVCPDCGNKRCPRATNHHNACTGSNAPGQAGSVFA